MENLSQQLSQTSVQEDPNDDGLKDVYGISYDAEKEGKINIFDGAVYLYFIGVQRVASDDDEDLIMDWDPQIMHVAFHSEKTKKCISSAVTR